MEEPILYSADELRAMPQEDLTYEWEAVQHVFNFLTERKDVAEQYMDRVEQELRDRGLHP